MSFTKMMLVGLVGVCPLLVGCESARFNSPYQTTYQRPAPISAAPAGQISQSQLPPPEEAYGDGQYPLGNEQVAALETPGNALEMSASSIAGVWQASVDGMPCQIATPMTKSGQGYRAGPMRCPAALSTVAMWNVQGRELVFYNREGAPQATLYSTNGTSFIGRAQNGSQIILTR